MVDDSLVVFSHNVNTKFLQEKISDCYRIVLITTDGLKVEVEIIALISAHGANVLKNDARPRKLAQNFIYEGNMGLNTTIEYFVVVST